MIKFKKSFVTKDYFVIFDYYLKIDSKVFMTIEDKLFIDYIESGNNRSFEELVKRVRPWLSKLIYRIVGDSDIAYDIQQEAWIKLISYGYKFKPSKGKITSLIFKIAYNEALTCKDKNHKNICFYEENFNNNKSFSVVNNLSPEAIAVNNDICNIIRSAISQISFKYQDVILLYYFSDFEVKEISDLLDTNEGTVKTWLDRGRKELKIVLSNYKINEINYVTG